MQIKQLLVIGTAELNTAGIELAVMESRLLLAHAMGFSQERLLLNFDKDIQDLLINNKTSADVDDIEGLFLSYIRRRCRLEPMAYIIGVKEFYSREFIVNRNVLIPRPETELLVDVVLSYAKSRVKFCGKLEHQDESEKNHNNYLNVLDIGVGSGNISCSLLLEMDGLRMTSIDISAAAIEVASENARKFCIDDKIEFIQSDLFTNLAPHKSNFDIIVSNPPYIDINGKDMIAQETAAFEPHEALYAGDKGLKLYNDIFSVLSQYLKPSGKLFLEVGIGQVSMITDIAKNYSIEIEVVYKDLQGIDRVIVCSGS